MFEEILFGAWLAVVLLPAKRRVQRASMSKATSTLQMWQKRTLVLKSQAHHVLSLRSQWLPAVCFCSLHIPPHPHLGPVSLKQVDLRTQLETQSLGQKISDDFVASFLHAGLPIAKLEHKSIRGLFRKYTKVEGTLAVF